MCRRFCLIVRFFATLLLLLPTSFVLSQKNSNNDDPYVRVGQDTIMKSSEYQRENRVFDTREQFVSSEPQRTNRDAFLEILNNGDWESYKTEDAFWSAADSDGRKTLTQFHYVVLPVWWDGETPQVPADITRIQNEMDHAAQDYTDMSWSKFKFTYEILDQIVLSGVTADNADFGNSEQAAREYVNNVLGLVEFVDYTGIILMYNLANDGSPFAGGGGWAGVNDNFMWASFPGWFDVFRHEAGHNYGHPHHLVNSYEWRLHRNSGNEFAYDGWDMMSGGNGYAVSHLAAASKWHYNWITDDAIVLMEPEGPSSLCPSCLSSVSSLELKSFDDRNILPSPSNKMAVHIPISCTGPTCFSYWLSYRGAGNDGLAAIGLSVHATKFDLGGIFGASYDSRNYDAFAETDDTFDSFVLPNTCFVVAPPGWILDVDPGAVEQVQPIVCVDDIDVGKSITVSVSFLDDNAPPEPKVALTSTDEIACSLQGTTGNNVYDLSNGNVHLLHFTGTGFGGDISLSLCLQSGLASTVKAYFYDAYPYAYLSLDAPAGYGAFRSLEVESTCSSLDTLNYESIYRETFVLLVPDQGAASTTTVQSAIECTVETCHDNQYMSDAGTCVDCPAGSVAPSGSDSITQCTLCEAEGFEFLHPFVNRCVLSDAVDSSLTTAQEWRILATEAMMEEWWVWDVHQLNFYSDQDCATNSLISTSGAIAFLDSGNAGEPSWGPTNAFNSVDSPLWGGRSDARKVFYVGLDFGTDISVKCIQLIQDGGHRANELRIQARPSGSSSWTNIYAAKELVGGENILALSTNVELPTPMPSSIPSMSPSTMAPTPAPSKEIIDPSQNTARQWRIVAAEAMLEERWVWDVHQLNFYSDGDCNSGSLISTSSAVAYFDSGNAGEPSWGPANAFNGVDDPLWGGRADAEKVFYVGLDFGTDVTVQCVVLIQDEGFRANELRIQTRSSSAEVTSWITIYAAKDLVGGQNVFPLNVDPSTSSPSSMPSLRPSNSPSISAPTSLPTKAPTSKGSSPECFSALNTVEVSGKGTIAIPELQVGDYVKISSSNKFSKVVSLAHFDHENEANYFQIHADGLDSPFEISAAHILFVSGRMKQAREVQIGDLLGNNHVVTHVSMVRRRGLYAPITESGTILVSGVLASSYAAVLDDFLPRNFQHFAAHYIVFTPLRLICSMNFDICAGETYTNGFSDHIRLLVQFLSWVSNCWAVVPLQVGLALICAPFMVLMAVLEHIIIASSYPTLPWLLALLLLWLPVATKTKVDQKRKVV